jgi:hypothetical protein
MEVYFHMQNMARFSDVLDLNRTRREQLYRIAQQARQHSDITKTALHTVRSSVAASDPLVVQRAEATAKEAEEGVRRAEKRNSNVVVASKVKSWVISDCPSLSLFLSLRSFSFIAHVFPL